MICKQKSVSALRRDRLGGVSNPDTNRGDGVISNFCSGLNYLTGANLLSAPSYLVFLPFLLILVPLCTVDKAYWDRIKGKTLLAPLFLLDFVNYPTTALTTFGVFLWGGFIGYMHRYCILMY